MGGKSSSAPRSFAPAPESGPAWEPRYQPGERGLYDDWRRQEADKQSYRPPPQMQGPSGMWGDNDIRMSTREEMQGPQPQTFDQYRSANMGQGGPGETYQQDINRPHQTPYMGGKFGSAPVPWKNEGAPVPQAPAQTTQGEPPVPALDQGLTSSMTKARQNALRGGA